MKNYIISHWRGEQGLLRSCLLNGVVLFILFGIALGILSAVLTLPVIWISHTHAASPNPNNNMAFGIVIFTVPFTAIYMVWACVGIFRCGLRNVKDRATTTGKRIGGAAALLWAAYLAYSTVRGLANLVPYILAGPNAQ